MNKDAFLQPAAIAGPFAVNGLGDVYVREVAYADAGFVYEAKDNDPMDVSARIIITSVCDENGEPVFARDDYDKIRKIPAMRMQRLMELANEHSGFGADVEAIAGNSEATT